MPIEGAEAALRDARDTGGEAWDVLRHVRCAQLDEEVYAALAGRFEARFRVLRLPSVRYFPVETPGRLWDYLGDTADEAAVPVPVASEGGRGPGTGNKNTHSAPSLLCRRPSEAFSCPSFR